jgi:hypothetical protein
MFVNLTRLFTCIGGVTLLCPSSRNTSGSLVSNGAQTERRIFETTSSPPLRRQPAGAQTQHTEELAKLFWQIEMDRPSRLKATFEIHKLNNSSVSSARARSAEVRAPLLPFDRSGRGGAPYSPNSHRKEGAHT